MKTLALAEVAIERVPADVAVVALFADERPLRGAAGRLDWRLCGRLSRLVAAGRLSGQSGEAVLTPGGGGVRARAVVGLGLGSRGRSGCRALGGLGGGRPGAGGEARGRGGR